MRNQTKTILFLFENNDILSYPDIQLLSLLKPQVPERTNTLGLLLRDQSCNVMEILLLLDNIA